MKRKAITAIYLLLVGACLMLLLRQVDLREMPYASFDVTLLSLSLMLGLSFRTLGAFSWAQILKRCGARNLPSFIDLNEVYAKAWMGRYLPGKITWLAGKIYFAEQHGIDKTQLVMTAFLEVMLQLVVMIALAFVFLLISGQATSIPNELLYVSAVSALGLGILLVPKVFNRAISVAYSLLTRSAFDTAHWRVDGSVICAAVVLYGACFVATGASYYFLCVALVGWTSWHEFLYLLGAFNLAGSVGTLAIFAPGGIGVREGVQAMFLSQLFGLNEVLVLVVVARVWSLLIDIFYFGLSVLAVGRRTGRFSKRAQGVNQEG